MIFRFLLGKVAWEAFHPTIPFFLALAAFGAVILVEVLGAISALVGFFARKLQIDGQQLKYTSWYGHTVSFCVPNISSYHTFRIGGMLIGDFFRFTDFEEKKHFACIYLSEYSRILFKKYLEQQGFFRNTE